MDQALDQVVRARQLIACEIHDGFIQTATAALIRLEAAKHQQKSRPTAGSNLAQVEIAIGLLRDSLKEARHLLTELTSSVSSHLPLTSRLSDLTEELQVQYGLQIDVSFDLRDAAIPSSLSHTVFRIAQECLRNACRHSHSSRVRIAIRQASGVIILDVQDWGTGFPVPDIEKGRFGIKGIFHRVHQAGGKIDIDSRQDKGTWITVELPYDNPLGHACSTESALETT